MKNIAMTAILLLSLIACQSKSRDDHEGHDHEGHGDHDNHHLHDQSIPSDTTQESFSLSADSFQVAPVTPMPL